MIVFSLFTEKNKTKQEFILPRMNDIIKANNRLGREKKTTTTKPKYWYHESKQKSRRKN